MKFPGSKFLHQVDLSNQGVALSDVLRSCQQVGLTGFAEVRRADAMGMIFYYLGGEVNALFREGQVAHNGQAAIDRLRALTPDQEMSVAVYELPLDMAHLLRGITQRRKLKGCWHVWRKRSTPARSRSRRRRARVCCCLCRGASPTPTGRRPRA
jgi:hypothetical protein